MALITHIGVFNEELESIGVNGCPCADPHEG